MFDGGIYRLKSDPHLVVHHPFITGIRHLAAFIIPLKRSFFSDFFHPVHTFCLTYPNINNLMPEILQRKKEKGGDEILLFMDLCTCMSV